MSAILTNAGATHLMQLADPLTMPDNSFGALIFGEGNDEVTAVDVLESLTQRQAQVARVKDGFPALDQGSSRNGGGGADVWTWRFDIEAGTPFVASNCAITNYSGGSFIQGAPLAVHAKQPVAGTRAVAQRHDERLIVWVNAKAGEEPTVFTAPEQSLDNRVLRVAGFAARNRSLGGHPNASVVNASEVRTRPHIGQHVWTASEVIGPEGRTLRTSDVEQFTVAVDRYQASEGQFVSYRKATALDCAGHVFEALLYTDPRYPPGEGYNVSHVWIPPKGTGETTWRITYRMKLCDGDVREFTNTAEVRH